METLLSARTTNGSGTPVVISDGGFRLLRVYGTFDGATATLEYDFNGSGTWVADSAGAFTVADTSPLTVKTGLSIRMTLSGVGASTSISAEMI